jgi:5,10-methylenetetrahydromethanopterin reductase
MIATERAGAFEIGLGWAAAMKPGDYGPLAAYAEELGIDALVVYSDLLFQPPLGPLLEMAAATQRVQLGLGCLTPYTLHPVEIAGQIAYLDAASAGRAFLGLVRGAWMDRLGLDQRRAVTTIRETVEVVRRLLSDDRSGFTGSVYSLDAGLGLQYRPYRTTVPLTIGTWSPRLGALAGAVADEVEIGGTANPEMVEVIRRHLVPGAATAGRDVDDVVIAVNPLLVVDEDGDAARAVARRTGAMYVEVVAALDPTVEVDPELLSRMRALLAEGRSDEAGALVSRDLLRKFLICGTPTEVTDHLLELREAGVGRVYLGSPFGLEESRGLELLGSAVLPAVRKSA